MKIDHFKTTYCNDTDVTLRRGHYHDGSTALVAMKGGELLAKLTVCLSAFDQFPAAGNVFIKDYSENEGVLRALRAAEVVGEPVRSIPLGYELGQTMVYECPLLSGDIEEL